MKAIHIVLALLLALLAGSVSTGNVLTSCTHLPFLPMPKSIECNLANRAPVVVANPCSILYIIKDSKSAK